MKALYNLFLLALVVGATMVPSASAQNRAAQGRLSGIVQDADTGDAIISATVAVWQAADSSLVTGAITQVDGSFALDGLRQGTYYVKISFVGYETQTLSGIALGPEAWLADLGTITLSTDAQMLDEVEVVAEREFMEVGIDRTVYNTKDQLVSAGGNASEVLEKIPSVEVDIDGNVSLRGSQNVAILINGRPSPMTGEALTSFLQGLPADAIERVEVIPNPSAKYEPDGMAGILNLVLAKDRDLGLAGGINLSADNQDSYNISGNLSYQKGRVGVYTTYGFRTGQRNSEGWRYRENRVSDPLSILNQDSFDENSRLSNTLNTSLDYKLSDRNTLSLSALLSHRSGDSNGLTAYTEMNKALALTGRYNRSSLGEGNDFGMDYRLGFKHVVEPARHELSVEARFEADWGNDFDRYTEEVFSSATDEEGVLDDQQTNRQDDQSREVALQVDYIRPLGEEGKIEAGYKGSLERLNNDFYSESFDPALDAWMPDAHLNNTFGFDEQIHAAYGIAAGKVGRIGVQAGVRVEQAFTTFDLETTGEAFDNSYFSVFPSAYLTYEFSQARNVKLSYSKRINRPRTRQLNPFSSNDDPLFRFVGNPYLKPEYVHSFEAGFTQFAGPTSLTISPYFRHTNDIVRRYETLDANGVTTLTFENLATSDSWGAEVIGTLRLGRWLNSYASFNAYKVVTDGSNVDTDLSNNAIGFSTRLNATVTLRPDLSLQASYFYRSPLDSETGRIAAMTSADLAVRQQFMNDRASLSLRVRDLFGTMGFHMLRDDAVLFQEFDRSFDSQSIGLTFTYNFGQADRKNRRNRNDDRGGEEVEMGDTMYQ